MLPEKLVLSKQNFEKLRKISLWYDACPLTESDGCNLSDSFHENIREYQMSLLPDVEGENDTFYFSYFDIDENNTFAVFESCENDDVDAKPIKLPIVCE